ncbi:DUF4177 domain-containing protein [Roseovarius sp. E0-M6]|uniref:DUF4177 domain-containing protein n=1 Tax=Roseovarius sp. E0-M6 TaxID=3127118 RepID=UPI00300FC034
MQRYEYKVIPAPSKGLKSKGIKGTEARFAHAIETTMNEMGNAGWTYLRADILPSEERQGLTSTTTVYRTLLVFQRLIKEPVEDTAPALIAAPDTSPEETGDETAEDAPDDTTPPSAATLAATLAPTNDALDEDTQTPDPDEGDAEDTDKANR